MGRQVREWTEAEMELLELYYALEGIAYIAQRTGRSADSIRQQATRLNLAEEMQEYTPMPALTREAGVSEEAVRLWLNRRGYRPLCRTWGRLLLVPAPAVRLYLHETRVARRPKGWWSSARAAAELQVSVPTLRTLLTPRTHGRTDYYDPQEVRALMTQLHNHPPMTAIRLRDLTGPGNKRQQALRWLRQSGHTPATYRHPQTKQSAHYVSQDAARAFLTAKGHREEMVETLLRKALLMQAGKEE